MSGLRLDFQVKSSIFEKTLSKAVWDFYSFSQVIGGFKRGAHPPLKGVKIPARSFEKKGWGISPTPHLRTAEPLSLHELLKNHAPFGNFWK